MIEITKRRAGTCDSCNQKPAEYSIQAGRDEWDGPTRICQVCMLGFAENNSVIRTVLFIQSGTRE
jgi:hypothetical protein